MLFLIANALAAEAQLGRWWMWGIELTNRDGALTWAVL